MIRVQKETSGLYTIDSNELGDLRDDENEFLHMNKNS